MVEQQQKQEKRFVQSQRKKQMQLSLHHMVRSLLVLTLGLSIISCSHLHQKVEYECFNLSVEDYDKVMISPELSSLMCQITLPINLDPTLHIDTLHND